MPEKRPTPADLLKNNRDWAEGKRKSAPDYFARMAEGQSPEFLWIGCSDSRVPPGDLVGLGPGELFVHRNIGNVVPHTDLNSLSVIQYAVEVLRVPHILVVGHYHCGGVHAAMSGHSYGDIDNWLGHIKDVWRENYEAVMALPEDERADKLVEFNVMAQVRNVARTTPVQNAWGEGRALTVHGWVHDLAAGRIRDLGVGVSGCDGLHEAYHLDGPC